MELKYSNGLRILQITAQDLATGVEGDSTILDTFFAAAAVHNGVSCKMEEKSDPGEYPSGAGSSALPSSDYIEVSGSIIFANFISASRYCGHLACLKQIFEDSDELRDQVLEITKSSCRLGDVTRVKYSVDVNVQKTEMVDRLLVTLTATVVEAEAELYSVEDLRAV